MSWRYYPLAEYLDAGVIVHDGKLPTVARYLTTKQAKAERPRQLERAK